MTPSALGPHARGRMFEHVVDALFRTHGYQTQANAVLVGRSGARHEIDVLAARSEDLVETRIGIECKNWAQPIDTAVVARARLVRDDLGLGQMIIACPAGATPAARATASQSGIAIWDRAELEARLGATAVAALGPAPRAVRRIGVPRAIPGERAARTLQTRRGGTFGLRRPQIQWTGDAWVTLHEVRFGCGERAGIRRRLHVRPAYGVYESLGGTALWAAARPTDAAEILADDAPSIPPTVSGEALAAELGRTVARAEEVVQAAARERHDAARAQRLIPDADHVSVDAVTSLEWPVTLALLEDRRGARIIVVDGISGRISDVLGEQCTVRLGSLARHLGFPQPIPGAGVR